jgi:hypothetical protein
MPDEQKPMFSDDEEQRPLLTKKELRDTCLHNAATIVIAFVLGCEFEDCRSDDDGLQWPTFASRIEIKYPDDWRSDWRREAALSGVAAIHEAGAMAVAKQHDLGAHLIQPSLRQVVIASETLRLLDDPLVWKTIKALARFIESDGSDGCYDAIGTDAFEVGDDSAALKLIRDMGLTRGCRRLDDLDD